MIIRKISDQIMNRGNERIINVNTDGSSIKASSSNTSVARVSTRRDDTLIIEAVGTGTARITVTASRRGYRDATTQLLCRRQRKDYLRPDRLHELPQRGPATQTAAGATRISPLP